MSVRRRTIDQWNPNDPEFWEREGRYVARRNLIWSIFAEFLGFSVWQLWSVTAVKLPDAGFAFTTSQLFWLVAIPGLVGATMRFPYTLAPAVFGGRNWTVVSALLLLIPCLGLVYAVSDPATPYWVFLALAATAGFGGGNFSSSMANISFFYPDDRKGAALGLNAAGGNLGVAVVQKLVPAVIVIGGGLHLANAGLVYVPLIFLSAFCAWRFMDNLAEVRCNPREQIAVVRRPYTWVTTWLYIGAFGSFIGYSAALPLLIKTQFESVDPLTYAFLGPLVGSVARPFGGWLSDKLGGARVTLGAFTGMAAGVPVVIAFLHAGTFGGFLATFMWMFVMSGMANGSVYRMVGPVARVDARKRGVGDVTARREAAAVIGFSSAVGAYGGFLIPEGFKRSLEATGQIDTALYAFLVFYVSCGALTWWVYMRRSFATRRLPSFAEAQA